MKLCEGLNCDGSEFGQDDLERCESNCLENSFGDLDMSSSSFSSNHAESLGGGWSNHNIGGTVTMSGVGCAANSTDSGSYEDCYDVDGGCQQ